MSDDMWRQRERPSDPSEEFGGPLFPDEDPDAAADRPDDTGRAQAQLRTQRHRSAAALDRAADRRDPADGPGGIRRGWWRR